MSHKHRVPSARRSIRLQGKDFAELKDKLIPVSYSVSLSYHVCVTYQSDSGQLYHHWLNDTELSSIDLKVLPKVDFRTMKGGEDNA